MASWAVPPAAAIRAHTSSVRVRSRPHTVTWARSAANAVAMPSPIPLEAPVTTARFVASLLNYTTSAPPVEIRLTTLTLTIK